MPGAAQQLRQAPLPPGASVKDKQARHELYLRLLRATAASLLHFTASGDGDPSPLGGEGICCHRHGRGNCCQRQICRGAAASSSQRRPAGSPRALAVRSAPRPHATPRMGAHRGSSPMAHEGDLLCSWVPSPALPSLLSLCSSC